MEVGHVPHRSHVHEHVDLNNGALSGVSLKQVKFTMMVTTTRRTLATLFPSLFFLFFIRSLSVALCALDRLASS
jgi:hypothetical protein